VTVACTKLRWIWEEMVSDPKLQLLLSEIVLSNRRPDELLEPIIDEVPSPDTWKVILQAWEAVGELAEGLRTRLA
jgi:hypothetical protein